MSHAHTSPAPAASAAGTGRRLSIVGWIAGGIALAACLIALTIAIWPASEADKARDDGEQLGAAVATLYNAQSPAQVDAALIEVRDAADQARAGAGDAVAGQISDQADALDRAAEGFVGQVTTDDEWEADLYQAELDYAVDDLTRQADDWRAQGAEVRQAFAEGFDSGFNGS
jgi:hypothetical protein